MRSKRVLRGFGVMALGGSVVALLFVAYMLWGTAIVEGRGQQRLRSEFEAQRADDGDRGRSPGTSAGRSRRTTRPDAVLDPPGRTYEGGTGVAHIEIPTLGVQKFVVEGVDAAELQTGPGHYPHTPMPGEPGNVAIAGHRTTYGAPFGEIDELEPRDPIRVSTVDGEFDYEVIGQLIVAPADTHVIGDYGDNRLTLTSCHPRGSASQRIIVVAAQVTPPTALQRAQIESRLRSDAARARAGATDLEAQVAAGPVEAVATGFDGNHGSLVPVVVWALVWAAVVVGVWAAGRLWRRWAAYLLGAPLILAALVLWFERVADVLPAGY